MLKPISDQIIVELTILDLKTPSGIYIPSTKMKHSQVGIIKAAGKGKLLQNGTYSPLEVSIGDKVLFNKFAGEEVMIDDKPYLILKEKDVLCIL